MHKRKPVVKEPSPDLEEEPEADEDVEMAMEDDDVVEEKPKRTRKKKEKKVIPVGKNGLKKKRVVKSRTRMEGGYMGACYVSITMLLHRPEYRSSYGGLL